MLGTLAPSPAPDLRRRVVAAAGAVLVVLLGALVAVVVVVLDRHLGHPPALLAGLSASLLATGAALAVALWTVVGLRDDRVRAEELVGRLSNAVHQTADAVFITDRSGVIEYVNPAFERTSGYRREEVVGKTPRVLKSGVQGAEYYDRLWRTVLAGEPFHGASVNRKRDGRLYHAEQTITPMRTGDGEITHFVSVMRDMTDRRLIEEQEVELRLAGSIQRRLLPRPRPRTDGYEIAGTVSPALAVCGDYYDAIDTLDGQLCLAVGDARGHGVGPALIAVQTRAHLRSLLQAGLTLDRALFEINRILVADLDHGLFITLAVVRIDLATGALEWASAGHPTAYVLDAAGAVTGRLGSTGLPLGLLADRPYTVGNGAILEPGGALLMVSDGILEAEAADGTEFGIERLHAVMRGSAGLPAAEIVQGLQDAVQVFVDGQPRKDDLTAVVCARAPDA